MSYRDTNRATLIGKIIDDPQFKEGVQPKGTAMLRFTLGTTSSWQDRNSGQKHERTERHRVVIFGKLADEARRVISKGTPFYVEGRIQTRGYETGGEKRYTTEIVVDGTGQAFPVSGDAAATPAQAPASRGQQQSQYAPHQADYDDWPDPRY